MKEQTTKQRILTEAIKLFAKSGYETVTVEQIATAVGIKAPSLYKHYKSKRDIFECILKKMSQTDYERAKEYGMPEGTMSEMAEKYSHTPLQKIKEYSEVQFLHWTQDEFSCSFRKLLTIEQFKNKEMSELYRQYLGAGPLEYMADLFAQMTKDKDGAMQLALEFYSPMYLLYSVYDATENDTEKKKIIRTLHDHIDRFAKRLED